MASKNRADCGIASDQVTSEAELEQVIGKDYVETDVFPDEDSDEVREQYQAIARRHELLYDQIPVPVLWTYEDPYESPAELFERVAWDQELWVFAGGSHPDALTAEQNVKGRAVHDYFGHYGERADFSVEGEFTVWRHTTQCYPPETHRLLFTEIVGQRCAGGYLDDGFDDSRFTQRAFPAPESWIELCEDVLL